MTRIPDLWWSPSEGLFHRYPGEQQYRPVLNEDERRVPWRAERAELPKDAVRLCEDFGADYIRVGETIATMDRKDVYVLASGMHSMYLEPVDTGEGHMIDLADGDWTMKHPVTCRAKIFECPVHIAALAQAQAFTARGRFTCSVVDGYLVISHSTLDEESP